MKTRGINLGITKTDGKIAIFNTDEEHPDLFFVVQMKPDIARRFTELVTAVIDGEVPEGCSTYIRAEQMCGA